MLAPGPAASGANLRSTDDRRVNMMRLIGWS